MISISVIIPTCNRPAMLRRCLDLLGDNTHGEVIVSDDSVDATTKVLAEKEFAWVRWIQGPRRGPAANRNCGANAATGEWLVFLDDDCEPQPGWLEAFASATSEADILEGKTVAPGARDTPFEEHVENLTGGVLWSCNLAVRREVFVELGGFDMDFLQAGGEDMEFAWRVAHARKQVRFVPKALVYHPPRPIGWRGIWRRTWMIRWITLYRLKTGQSGKCFRTVILQCVGLLRMVFHLWSKRGARFPCRRWFYVFWAWLTFPLVLPWLLYWRARFRQMLQKREKVMNA